MTKEHTTNEVVFQIGGEGGSIKIIRAEIEKKVVFIYEHQESYFEEDLNINKSMEFYDFDTPLKLIFNKYPVHLLYISNAHHDYKKFVAKELVKAVNAKCVVPENFYSKEETGKILGVEFKYDVQTKNWSIE